MRTVHRIFATFAGWRRWTGRARRSRQPARRPGRTGQRAGHCKKNGGIPPSPTFQQLMAARRLLCRRYYPEGGWGWVVIVVGILVHTMTHGLQLSYGPLMANVMRYFGKPFTDTECTFFARQERERCERWNITAPL
uniref:Uncharacterized protein n=1 Tax=Anopheles coluzzii TaxID=1518534 RepID=A0A8W7PWH2_ANOCL